jgi:Spy/CpxP family protein refolding chaperone
MTKELSLTEKQQAQVKEIMAAQKLKRDALREDAAGAGGREAAFQKLKDLRVETNGQIEAVLDDAQRKKYAAMISERRKRLGQLGGGGSRGGGGGKPPAN